jgi:hypothetical protein
MWGTQAGVRMHVIHLASVLRSGVGCRLVFSRYPALDIDVPHSISGWVTFASHFSLSFHPPVIPTKTLRSGGPQTEPVALGGPVPTCRDRPCRDHIGIGLPPLADLVLRSLGGPFLPLPTCHDRN